MWQDAQRRYTTTTRDDDDDARRHMTTCDIARQHRPTVTSRDDEQQRITTGSYYCKPRFASLLILPTYDFNLNDMQSTVISKCATLAVTKQGTQTSGAQRPQINTLLSLLIGLEVWLSTMGKRQMSSASTSVFYPLTHLQISTSAFYHRPT